MRSSPALCALCVLVVASVASAASNYEPPDGKAFLSFWINTTEQLDTPLKLDNRLGKKVSGFGFSQSIPIELDPYGARKTANLTFIEETKTDAFMFLTVYPDQTAGFDGIKDSDVNDLAEQLYELTMQSNRRVLLRYIPEMNGNWYKSYLGRPIRFKAEWKRLRTAVLAKTSKVDFVWSPNYGLNYPYGQAVPCEQGSQYYNATECHELDTSGDGKVDSSDDAYSPFYPGDDQVEWVGLSVYWKGGDTTKPANNICSDANEFGGFIDSGNFYQTYAVKAGKPFSISESGAAFGLVFDGKDITASGASQLDIQQSCWRTYITNPAFFVKYPKVKYVNVFEFESYENATDTDTILRDFRITADDTIRTAFLTDLQKADAAGVYLYANATPTDAPKTVAMGSVSAGVVLSHIDSATAAAPSGTGAPATKGSGSAAATFVGGGSFKVAVTVVVILMTILVLM